MRLSQVAGAGVTVIRQVLVLHRSRLIELHRPDRIVASRRAVSSLGPIAAGVILGARRHPDRTAVVDAHGALTYGGLDQLSDALTDQWLAHGIDGDSTVAVLCRDHRGLVSVMVAAGKLGARLILMNTGFSAHQLADVAARENVSAVVCDDELADIIARIPDDVIRLASTPSGERRAARGRRRRPRQQGGFVLLTGGTTGTPKGAPRTVGSPLAAAQFLDRVPLRRGQTMLLCAPLFHGTALSQFIVGLNLGDTIVLHGRFDAARAVAQIATHRCDVVVLVPTMLRRILDLGPAYLARYDTSSLHVVFSAGAALPVALGNAATDLFGDCIYNFYGCTETATATIATPTDWAAAPGTVGKPPIGIKVRLFDDDGPVESPGAKGVVHVGNSIAFQGYSGGGSKSSRDGLMSTGDIGHWDEGGRLFIDGRDDDMIVSGGENVFPGEVEEVLYTHPAVAEAAVHGVADDEFGQRLVAVLVLVPGNESPTAEDIRTFVKSRLARFKAPRDVLFVEELPRTVTGKIDRRRIRALDTEQPVKEKD